MVKSFLLVFARCCSISDDIIFFKMHVNGNLIDKIAVAHVEN